MSNSNQTDNGRGVASPQPPVPTTADTQYQKVLVVAATAIANEIAKVHKVTPAANMLALVDDKTRNTCLLYAKVVIEAVNRYGTQRAAELTEKRAAEEMRSCQVCNAQQRTAEQDAVTKVVHLTFECGGEVLLFVESGMTTTRRDCPKGVTE